MQTRHTNELMNRLERVADIGVAEVRKNELRKWYDQDRLSVNVWRDIEEKWHEVLLGEDYTEAQLAGIPLLIGESDGLFLFVYPNDKTEGWLWPISDWMKPKDRKPAKASD